jgi:ADP-heptose:LPS heptosyltransferase
MHNVKSIEIYFRRLLIRALKLIVKRKKPLSPDIDFNTCKILFIRQDRIGDVLISTPIYTVLKKRYPNAIVDFLLGSKNHCILENDPLVRKRWVYTKNVKNTVNLLLGVRREKYDFVIDLMDNPSTTSTFICLLANGSWNVGLCKENAYIYDLPVALPSRRDTHIVERTAQVLTVFGINPAQEKLTLHYNTSEKSIKFADAFLKEKGLLNKSILTVNISPAQGNKNWGKENYQRFIEKVAGAFPSLAILLLFQPSDKNEAQAIVQPFNNITLSPETKSFDQFAALVNHAAFLVTPDTSAIHLASAFKIPAVALYLQHDKQIRIWDPYGVDSETLVSDTNEMRTISPVQVFEAFERLYKRNITVLRSAYETKIDIG